MFEIGKHVKYMPPYKDIHDLASQAEQSGLAPRRIYQIKHISEEGLLEVEEGGSAPTEHFVSGELAFKLGKQDNSWEEQYQRIMSEAVE